MTRAASAWVVALLMAAVAVGGGKDGDDPVLSKARQLVDGKSSRLEKVQALHAFVRDEIGQTETKYG